MLQSLRMVRIVPWTTAVAGFAIFLTGCSNSFPSPKVESPKTEQASVSDPEEWGKHAHSNTAHGETGLHSKKIAADKADLEERTLFQTAGGKYTAGDIQANGNQVASVKFKGVKPTHDVKPQSGDKLCPISMTKANPKFSWVVDGQTYEFCCPPCVEEFVTLAKEKPAELKSAELYRQK